jgi:hypothetical protein
MQITTEIEIDAPVARVWDVLTDFPGYAAWNPFMVRLEGTVEVGARITIDIQPPGSKRRRMRERIYAISPQSELRWGAHLLVPGIASGTHVFRLETLPGGRTRLHHGEEFTGILIPFFRKLLARIEQGFVLTNEALKRHVEAGSREGNRA